MNIRIINKNIIKAYKKPIMVHLLLLPGGGLPFMVGFFVCFIFFACPVAIANGIRSFLITGSFPVRTGKKEVINEL